MPDYRAYILDREGKIQSFEPLVCANDDVAIATAKRLVNGQDVELWQGDRMVTKLAHKAATTLRVPSFCKSDGRSLATCQRASKENWNTGWRKHGDWLLNRLTR